MNSNIILRLTAIVLAFFCGVVFELIITLFWNPPALAAIIMTISFASAVWLVGGWAAERKVNRITGKYQTNASKGDDNDLPELHG